MRGISKSFDGVPVLKDVNFSLSKGEIVALMGENGAGKSTLMKILSGVYSADAGLIIIDSAEYQIREIKEAMNNGVVFIHQELNLIDNLDVASNIFLGREPLGRFGIIQKDKLYERAREVLEMLKVKIPAKALVSELSIGEQQMIEIAKAVSQKARILIMDEPTSSLTLTETKNLFKIIKDLKAKGVSIIYISHRLYEIYEIADRVVVLKDGCNSGELAKHEINHDNILGLMVGRSLEPATHYGAGSATHYDFRVSELRTQQYPEKKVSLQVGRGEIVGIAGLMGAGRTELVNTIFGVTSKLGGMMILNGQAIEVRRPFDAIGLGIFLIPEDRRKQGVITEMNVVDNITLTNLAEYSIFNLIKRKVTGKVADKLIRQLNITTAVKNPCVKFISGGNQQKVAVAKWLTRTPELLIFDEPTRGVDVGAKSEIYKIIRQLAKSNAMILLVSSDMEEIMEISDRIYVMSEGEMVGELERAEFTEEKIISMAVAKHK